ncbi:MAG: T9SS type A sorting domain-containing protein [Bacteroidota bacterium]|nr:T9SS type A sorting domain-containing protein [Bacteroidota bacterium]
MKKLLSILFLGAFLNTNAQSTLYNVYDSQGHLSVKLIQAPGTNKLYSKSNTSGTQINKMNLDGVPLSSRTYSYGIGDVEYYNGSLYGLGSMGINNYILKIDTGNLQIVQASQITFTNLISNSKMKIFGSTAYIVGSAQTSPTTGTRAMIISYDIGTSSLNYASVFSLPSSTVGVYFTNIQQLQNSSFIITGYHNSTGSGARNLIVRATSNSSVITAQQIVAGPYAELPEASVSLGYGSNNKIFISGTASLTRIDTNLTLLTSPGTYSYYGMSAQFKSNKLYSNPTGTNMVIYDNNLTPLNQVSYPFLPTFTAVIGYKIEDIAIYNNNLYFSGYGYCSFSCSTYVIAKTDLGGALNCSTPVSSNFSATPINSVAAISLSQTSLPISIGSSTIANAIATAAPGYTVNCLTATSVMKHVLDSGFNIHLNQNGNYTLQGTQYLSYIEIYDLSGKEIKSVLIHDEAITKTEFDLNQLSQGIYLIKVRYSGGSEATQKLIHLSSSN